MDERVRGTRALRSRIAVNRGNGSCNAGNAAGTYTEPM